jgi:hypothetical protein
LTTRSGYYAWCFLLSILKSGEKRFFWGIFGGFGTNCSPVVRRWILGDAALTGQNSQPLSHDVYWRAVFNPSFNSN